MELLGLGFFLAFALGVVIFLTRGLFARDLTAALKRVGQREQELQEKADILEQRLGQMEREYQAKLKRGDAEAERVIHEAKTHAMNIRTAAIEEAKHRARELFLEAEQGKTKLRADVTRELNGQAARAACESLRALLTAEQLDAIHAQLLKELLEALKGMDLRARGVAAERVEVVTAQPLASADTLRLTQWAAGSVGSDVPIASSVDPALVAGGVVKVGPTVVDNSLANRLARRGTA
jgi:F0F1-type ATP synthase delta subunit